MLLIRLCFWLIIDLEKEDWNKMYGIDILLREHEVISEFNDLVKKISLLLLDGASVSIDDLRFSIDFIREYADRIHHGKEEDFLFRDIENELGRLGKNLISHGMLVEHDLARYYVSQIDKAIESYEKEVTRETRLELISYLMSYRDLLDRHIYKENEVVYSYALKNLSEESLLGLDEKTRNFERANKKSKDFYLEGLEELKKKYKK